MRDELAQLPLFSAEELRQIHIGLELRRQMLTDLMDFGPPAVVPELRRQDFVCGSVDTAVLEAMQQIEAS